MLCLRAPAQQPERSTTKPKSRSTPCPRCWRCAAASRCATPRAWTTRRRPEILAIYETEVYGKAPAKPAKLNYEVKSVEKGALGGKAVRKIVTVFFGETRVRPKMDLLVYLPAGAKKPVPVFLGLSFSGIHTVANDPGVPLARAVGARTSNSRRRRRLAGAGAPQWQVDKILAAGYGLATVYYGEIEPDFVGGMKYGIRPLFFKPGQTEPAPGRMGRDRGVGLGGQPRHGLPGEGQGRGRASTSRCSATRGSGKTALWAGAQDTRFSIVISNESGEGGAAISRRDYGERTKDLNTRFPHWFDGNFKKYSEREDEMPFDSHLLLSLIAPRGLYVASAEDDQWSDPKGEFLGAANASPVWELFGKKGIGTMEMPGLHQPVGDHVRYHIRAGKHDVTAYDWEQYLKFAAAQWGR